MEVPLVNVRLPYSAMLEGRVMRLFLRVVGFGLVLLGLSAAVTILFFPFFDKVLRGSEIPVFGIVLRSEIALLVLSAWCSISAFLLFALAFRQRRIGLELKEAYQSKETKPAREDSESQQAGTDLKSKQAARRDTLLNIAGAGLLVLGLASATVIYLTKIGWLLPPRGTISLWLMFVPSTLLGVVAAWLAQQELIDQTNLVKKQISNERSDTTRQTTAYRSRARFSVRL